VEKRFAGVAIGVRPASWRPAQRLAADPAPDLANGATAFRLIRGKTFILLRKRPSGTRLLLARCYRDA
jgi:hypothetical protein